METVIADRLSGHVQVLAGSIGERNLWRYLALQAAADYIEDTLVELGYRPSDEPFESRGKSVRNIIAEKPGNSIPDDIVLVGAHYDSVIGSPGANDNGSGVAALLELARLLADREFPRTVRYVDSGLVDTPAGKLPDLQLPGRKLDAGGLRQLSARRLRRLHWPSLRLPDRSLPP